MAVELNIRSFVLGEWQTNCYLVWPDGSRRCWLIDAGFNPAPMIEAVRELALEPRRLVLTHAHVDHIAGCNEIREALGQVPIAIHEAEADSLTDAEKNLSSFAGLNVTAPPADEILHHGDRLELDGVGFEVRHTPGHSPGGITLYAAEAGVAFVGDALFAGSVGRYDFPTSDGATLFRSIRDQLLTLPEGTVIYPGHGPETTIARERRMNPFL